MATHELVARAPVLPDWADFTAHGRKLLGGGDLDLIANLSYALERIDEHAQILLASGTQSRLGVAIVLTPDESPDMEATDVMRLGGAWKERLHTRAPSGLYDN